VNDAIRAAQQASHLATLRLPVAFDFPLGGIVGRTAIGLALLAAGAGMLAQHGTLWWLGAVCFGGLGAVVAVSNLRALADPERRKIVLDEDGVEIRYGNSRRRYRFLDYSDYRISRLGLRRFLTALPIEFDRSLSGRAERVRFTLYDRPAFLAPMPMLGGGAPGSLLEWQATLNELRSAAVAAAGLTEELERAARERGAQEARNLSDWHARAQAGERPSRLSRAAYGTGRIVLTLLFFVLLFAPMGIAAALTYLGIVVCWQGCSPAMLQSAAIGGPLVAVLVFAAAGGRMMVKRAHDLDEELPYWKAFLGSLSHRGPYCRRLSREEGTRGTNRFGPPPK
jgi:hypothetical protein